MNRIGLIGGGLLALAVVGGAVLWMTRTHDAPVAWRTGTLERGALQSSVAAGGTVTPVRQVQIGTQVSGQIREVLVDFNSPVKAGQLIARLDPETFEYRVRQSSADVDAARAQQLTAQANVMVAQAGAARAQLELDEAKRDFARRQELVAQSFISPAELDRARALVATLEQSVKTALAQVRVAEAQSQSAAAVVRQREAQLAQAQVDLRRTEIRSPVDGIVIKRSIEIGQTVASSLQAPELFIVARNLEDLQVDVSIDEADVSRIRVGQKASFGVDALPGRSFEGTVTQLRKAALNQQNVITYIAVVAFRNPGELLLPGMTANVRIITDSRDAALKVPNAALRVRVPDVEVVAKTPFDAKESSGPAEAVAGTPGRVVVLDDQGRPRAYEVRVGISDGTSSELLLTPGSPAAQALQPGATVVVGVPSSASRGGSGGGRSPLTGPTQRPTTTF